MDANIIFAELRAIREDIGDLSTRTENGFKEMAAVYAAHELKDQREFSTLRAEVRPLSEAHRLTKRAVWSGIALIAAGVVDFVFDHLPKLLAHGTK